MRNDGSGEVVDRILVGYKGGIQMMWRWWKCGSCGSQVIVEVVK